AAPLPGGPAPCEGGQPSPGDDPCGPPALPVAAPCDGAPHAPPLAAPSFGDEAHASGGGPNALACGGGPHAPPGAPIGSATVFGRLDEAGAPPTRARSSSVPSAAALWGRDAGSIARHRSTTAATAGGSC